MTLNLTEVGAHLSQDAAGNWQVRLGIYLPHITAQKGYQVWVRIIHEQDQFTPEVPPIDLLLTQNSRHPLDLWEHTVVLLPSPNPLSHFGQVGTYLYRYQLRKDNQIMTRWFTDPFARRSGPAELSAFTTPPVVFNWTDQNYRVPPIDTWVVYELQVEEFNDNFAGVAERLPYLKGLGVNVLELMPITSVKQEFDWGYGPLHFWAPEERYGSPEDFKMLVNACHEAGIAVILDSVYEHVDQGFAYYRVYHDSSEQSPMTGHFAKRGEYGPETDFAQVFTREFFQLVNQYWLDEYHVDGFRYDFVPGYYDGPTGEGYADLVYQTYQHSLSIPRFSTLEGYSRVIQCAEQLEDPKGVLRDTYSDATWQDGLLNEAREIAATNQLTERFVHLLDVRFSGYPTAKVMNGVSVPVAPFQYIESHDHDRLITQVDLLPPLNSDGDIRFGNRAKYYKLQPFVVALYTCQGVPMLWQGQEFAENYTLPDGGNARISFRRGVHWEYFYDEFGGALIRLYRTLARLRQSIPALRGESSYYYYQESQVELGVAAYQRRSGLGNGQEDSLAMVFLNFSDQQRTLAVPFPQTGTYREMLDDNERGAPLEIQVVHNEQLINIAIPSNYGVIYVKQP